ncbi:MAG TPA: HPF/RaiA family ribosome-associated protein [Bacteriovoracaceae bacterium]|nr:HPF/RaiA family ribosome-associated protein [Bacteriovoracaceae bacterium]
MHVQVHYQGLENSPWMDQFISSRVSKLNRYLGQSDSVQVHLKYCNRQYVTSLAIHNIVRDYAFSSDGVNLYESFSSALEKASRSLGEHKRRLKDRINKNYFSIKKDRLV